MKAEKIQGGYVCFTGAVLTSHEADLYNTAQQRCDEFTNNERFKDEKHRLFCILAGVFGK